MDMSDAASCSTYDRARLQAGGGREDAVSRTTTVSRTFVNVVIHDEQDEKKFFGPSGSDFAKLLSFFYALLLMMLGLMLPVSEALNDTWLKTVYGAIFLTYLTIVGTGLLVYIQFFLLRKRGLRATIRSFIARARSLCSVVFPRCCRPLSKANPADPSAPPGPAEHSAESMTSADRSARNGLSGLRVFATIQSDTVTSPAKESPLFPRRRLGQGRAKVDAEARSLTEGKGGGAAQEARGAREAQGGLSSSRGDLDSVDMTLGSAEDLMGGDEVPEWVDLNKFGSVFTHHGSSLYLRLGALVFGLGHFVYCVLEIQNLLRPDQDCSEEHPYGWTFIPRLVFVLAQTFFLFKGTKVHIVRHANIAWFGLMHLMATNACLWFRTLVNEITLESSHFRCSSGSNSSHKSETVVAGNWNTLTTVALDALTNDSARVTGAGHAVGGTAVTESNCDRFNNFSSHYLFPFVLEYSLIAIGTLVCIMHTGIGPTRHKDRAMARGFRNLIRVCALSAVTAAAAAPTAAPGSATQEGHAAEGSDHQHKHSKLLKSHTGLFLGILLLGVSIIAIVLFYIYGTTDPTTASLILLAADVTLHACLLVAGCAAFVLTLPLGYLATPVSTDDILLLIAMTGSVLFELSVTIASSEAISSQGFVGDNEPLKLASSVLACSQSIIQAMLVLASLRRYPSERSHVENMPGRGTFAFLIIGNLAVWVLRSFVARDVDMTVQECFYGGIGWKLVLNVNYPLLLFFSFHSSVCFADVWHAAYTPINEALSNVPDRQQPRESVEEGGGEAPAVRNGLPEITVTEHVTPDVLEVTSADLGVPGRVVKFDFNNALASFANDGRRFDEIPDFNAPPYQADTQL